MLVDPVHKLETDLAAARRRVIQLEDEQRQAILQHHAEVDALKHRVRQLTAEVERLAAEGVR